MSRARWAIFAYHTVILSVWYRRLLGSDLLALPRVAALNLHGSLLPAYRGRAPVNWVLVNGERRTGVTLHHMACEADAGDIIAQQAIDIEPDDTAFTLYKRMVKIGVALLLDASPGVNMIRAVTHPYPGTFVGDGTGRLFLWAGAVLPDIGNGAAPGTLLEILPSQGITVATGEGALLLRRVQSAGVAEEPADVWALRRGMRPGVRLTEGA